ncbi:MAG: UvrD-helicase domain-containing protein [Planctomycetes bacterium]|nr:UvrD-helicase domain-containing protein [Planctomycetota bacterium]
MNAVERAARQQDRAARRAAMVSFDRPVVLEAGAGTGKTATLVARLLAWTLGPGWEKALRHEPERNPARVAARVLQRVVAITFTERAAAEMRERMAIGLERLRLGESVVGFEPDVVELTPDVRARRAEELLIALDRLTVCTIHAWCRRLLDEWAMRAGLHPTFEVDADFRHTARTLEEVVTANLPEAYGDPGDEDALRLAELGFDPPRIAEALEWLAFDGVSSRRLFEAAYDEERVRALRDELLQRTRDLLAILSRPIVTGRIDKYTHNTGRAYAALFALEKQLERAEGLADLIPNQDDPDLDALFKRLVAWRGENPTQGETKALGDDWSRLVEPAGSYLRTLRHVTRLDPEPYEAARRVLGSLLRRTEERLRRRGVLRFSDLLVETHALLERDGHVRDHVRRSLDQLLIDEFQDTDGTQCAIVARLALEGPREERPGLFLVGDPKQSIYGWRGADLGAYEAFVERVQADGGELHRLSVNFRSTATILAEVEAITAPVMQRTPGWQPLFQSLFAHEPGQNFPGAFFPTKSAREDSYHLLRRPIEHWVSWSTEDAEGPVGAKTTNDRARLLEARALARDLRDLHDTQGVPWSRTAVLLRASTSQDVYLDALREAGIPYVVDRDRSYYKRREILDATALLRAVIDPSDRLGAMAFLRSPLAGVPDAAWPSLLGFSFFEGLRRLHGVDAIVLPELVEIVRRAERELPNDVPGRDRIDGWVDVACEALHALAELRRSFVDDPADVFVERLQERLLVLETEAARFLGVYRHANLERFFRQLLDSLRRGRGGPQALVRELRLAVSEAWEEQEGTPGDEQLDAVRFLTIHGAKGLTFDHVYVMDLHHRSSGDRTDAAAQVEWVDGRPEFVLLGLPSLRWDRAEERRSLIARFEMVRTLYVAITRPRERLVLAGAWEERNTDRPAERAASFVQLLEHRQAERPDLVQLLETETRQGDAIWVDACDAVLFRILAREGELPRPADEQAAKRGERTPARDRERLQVARRRAHAHADRPFLDRPSREEREALDDLPEDPSAREGHVPARVAAAVGTLVHEFLERLDLTSSPAQLVERFRPLAEHGFQSLDPEERQRARAELIALVRTMERGTLLPRLLELRDHVIARELPFLLAGEPDTGPVGGYVGSIDLVYRDPATSALVLVDFKTDRLRDDDELRQRMNAYRRQASLYLHAIREGFPGASETPCRFEWWFLALDRVEPLVEREGVWLDRSE